MLLTEINIVSIFKHREWIKAYAAFLQIVSIEDILFPQLILL